MSSLDLPMTQDGSGYEKSAVEEYVKQADYRARHLIQQAESLLSDAIEKKGQIVAEGEQESQKLIDEANRILAEAQIKSDTLDAEIDNLKAVKLEEIKDELEQERAKGADIVKNAEQQASKMLAEAKLKANSYIEENRSRVHGIVKNAENKRQEAEREAKALVLKATRAYSDSIAGAGKLSKEAKEVLEDAKIESETLLTYATEEAKNLKNDSEAKAKLVIEQAERKAQWITTESENQASRIIEDAQKYSNDVAVWAAEEIDKSVSIINQYKAFYDDNISRMLALFNTNIEMVSALGNIQFPDGSHNFKTIEVVDIPNKDTKDDEPVNETSLATEGLPNEELPDEELPDDLISDLDSLIGDLEPNDFPALETDSESDSPVLPPRDGADEEVVEIEDDKSDNFGKGEK